MLTDSGLDGKVAIVTGGSRGIGRAIVELLAAHGADVTLFYRDNAAAAAEVVAAGAAKGGKIAAEQVDVRDATACAAAVERVAERRERIDLLVNNAGLIRDNQLAAMDDDDVDLVLDTNIGGVFNMARAVVPHMIVQRSGKIINLSSVVGRERRTRADQLCSEQGSGQRLHAVLGRRARGAQNHGQRGCTRRDRDRNVRRRCATWRAAK